MSDNLNAVVKAELIKTFNIPSISKGEVPLLTFHGDNGIEIGKLMGTNNILSFQGDADKSAHLLFEHVIDTHLEVLHSNKARIVELEAALCEIIETRAGAAPIIHRIDAIYDSCGRNIKDNS